MNPMLMKKKSILSILGMDEGEEAPKEEMDPVEKEKKEAYKAAEEGSAMAGEVAAKMLLKSIEAKNPKLIYKAMKNLINICDSEEDVEEETIE